MRPDALVGMIAEVATLVIDHADELTKLDQAIGDGDHGVNIRRGCEAVIASLPTLQALSVPQAFESIGTTLVMTVGGASGPLLGTFFRTLGLTLPREPGRGDFGAAAGAALEAVKARGRSDVGQKTLLDVLAPFCQALTEGMGRGSLKTIAAEAAQRTVAMQALRGRAAFLGARSIGHMDPGARSASLIIAAAVDAIERVGEPA